MNKQYPQGYKSTPQLGKRGIGDWRFESVIKINMNIKYYLCYVTGVYYNSGPRDMPSGH